MDICFDLNCSEFTNNSEVSSDGNHVSTPCPVSVTSEDCLSNDGSDAEMEVSDEKIAFGMCPFYLRDFSFKYLSLGTVQILFSISVNRNKINLC